MMSTEHFPDRSAGNCQLYRNARIFTADRRRWAEALVVDGAHIAYVGDAATAERIAGPGALIHDLEGATVLPGFVDGHAHIVGTGEAAEQVDLWHSGSLEEIQRRIRLWIEEHPGQKRILATGWNHSAVGGHPDRAMLDAVTAEVPIYAQAYDFHSIWLNTAALAEAGIDDATVSPPGGSVHRDADGHATGYIDETAMHELVWPVLDGFVDEAERDRALATALAGYAETGVTGSTDMALGEDDLAAMRRADAAGTLTARIAGFWKISPTGDEAQNLAQVARAAELMAERGTPFLRVTGIKIIVDGTVDGCTAALGRPYANGDNADPVWSRAELAPVVAAADAVGLQVAMHAIGDEAVRIAIDAVEHAAAVNGPRERRHRIEHLEVVESADVQRLAAIGITASMQPVHAEPSNQENWRAMLGDERVDRGFPWTEMTGAGARLAFGTDSPTAPHAPLPNMFIAATRRSPYDETIPANLPEFVVPLQEAIVHATRDSAWASRAEHSHGRLAIGLHADFVVLDRDVFARPVEELLQAKVLRTVVGGRTVHRVIAQEAS